VIAEAMIINKLAGILLAAATLLVFEAPAAEAAPPQPFTIREVFDINTGATSFTATGALCPRGTFKDEVHAAGGNASRFNELFRTVYTCDNGDTFFGQKHLHLVFNEDGSITNTGGPITLEGGTGVFARLSGHGVDKGMVRPDRSGFAEISGLLKLR
jgi:hypothetical protein